MRCATTAPKKRHRKGNIMTLTKIIRLRQKQLKKALFDFLVTHGYNPISSDGFLYAAGDIPILLTAHMDTVHTKPVKRIVKRGNIWSSPQGIGGDDRAGVYIISRIIASGYKPHVLFCEDEESGGIGARKFVKSGIMPDVNYIIGLDRRGSDDAVFYDCYNKEFVEYIESFGFKEALGTFSDISIIAPALGVAAVNLSTGFYREHTKNEYIDIKVMGTTFRRVADMLKADSKPYDYASLDLFDSSWYYQEMLMPLPDSAFIRIDGDVSDSTDFHLIDSLGRVYMYDYDLDMAVQIDGADARTSADTPLRFNRDEAFPVSVYDDLGFHDFAEVHYGTI